MDARTALVAFGTLLTSVLLGACSPAPNGNDPKAGKTVVVVGPSPDAGTGPATAATTTLQLAPAADLGAVNVTPNGSSVVLYVPAVAGAKDYRVFAVDGVTTSIDSANHEHIKGATIHCAGLRQRNQCSADEILPINYGNVPLLNKPSCRQRG